MTMPQRSYNTMESGETGTKQEGQIIVIGKTGNGKSTVGNAILGREEFPVGRGMASTTQHAQKATEEKPGKTVTVIDTPDFTNMPHMNTQDMQQEVTTWKKLAGTFRLLTILLTVRCDVRYTAEEYDIYRRIKLYWGNANNFCSRLIVVFTFGDRQDKPLGEELKHVCPELKSVLKDASNRYVLFDKTQERSSERLWNSLDGYITEMDARPSLQGRRRMPMVKVATYILAVLLAVFFILCIVFIIQSNTVVAIVMGVLCVIPGGCLAFILYSKRDMRTLQ